MEVSLTKLATLTLQVTFGSGEKTPRIIRVIELPLHSLKTLNTKCMEAQKLDTILGSTANIIERVYVMP